jgi:hypothetical protein
MIAYPADGTAPNLSLVNITGGANVANAATIVLSTTDGQSVALKSSINVPAIVDVLGYYYPQCQ